MDIELYAKIPLSFLPRNWAEIIEEVVDKVVEEPVCQLSSQDFEVRDGLVLKQLIIGNGCLDEVLDQIRAVADAFGVEPIIRWRYL